LYVKPSAQFPKKKNDQFVVQLGDYEFNNLTGEALSFRVLARAAHREIVPGVGRVVATASIPL